MFIFSRPISSASLRLQIKIFIRIITTGVGRIIYMLHLNVTKIRSLTVTYTKQKKKENHNGTIILL